VGTILLDLEGTLYAKGEPIPGATAAVAALREQGHVLRFLTNTDSKPLVRVAADLEGFGLRIRQEELFTPVVAAQRLLEAAGGNAYLVVAEALRTEFKAVACAPCTHVLVGDCRDTLDYSLLDGAFRALRAGAQLVALQRGRYFKRADGDHLDTGAVVAALEYAAGCQAVVVGKPSAEFFTLAADSAGTPVTGCVVVGDDATTDIAGGRAAGAVTVQVRTGKFADQQAEGLTGGASHTIDSIVDLPDLLAGPR